MVFLRCDVIAESSVKHVPYSRGCTALHIRTYVRTYTYIVCTLLSLAAYVCSSTQTGQYSHLPLFVQCIHHAVLGTVNLGCLSHCKKKQNPNWPIKCELHMPKRHQVQRTWLISLAFCCTMMGQRTWNQLYVCAVSRTNREHLRTSEDATAHPTQQTRGW